VRAVATLAVGVALVLAGCGDDDERAAAPPPPATLPADAVPYLESEERPLTAAIVAREAGKPELAARLEDWGYDRGASRYFQGQSRRLQVVDSRTHRFRSAEGAESFLRLVRANPEPFFPGAGKVRDFSSRGRQGIVVEGAPCACHLATPAFSAVVRDGNTVSSLEINGARASLKVLRRLAAEAP